MRRYRDPFKQFKQRMLNESFQNKWYLVKKGDEYFTEKEVTLPHSEIKKKILFRDFNNEIMSLGKDKEWAEQWIFDKNEIDGYLQWLGKNYYT